MPNEARKKIERTKQDAFDGVLGGGGGCHTKLYVDRCTNVALAIC
jgi:hypothetical protein